MICVTHACLRRFLGGSARGWRCLPQNPIFCVTEHVDLVSQLSGRKSFSTACILEDLCCHRLFMGNQEGFLVWV